MNSEPHITAQHVWARRPTSLEGLGRIRATPHTTLDELAAAATSSPSASPSRVCGSPTVAWPGSWDATVTQGPTCPEMTGPRP